MKPSCHFAARFAFTLAVALAWIARGDAAEVIVDTPFDMEYHEPHALPSAPENDVRAIAIDPSGRVWIATAAGARFHEQGRWSSPAAGVEGASPAHSLFVDSRGQVWVGAWNGVYRADANSVVLSGAEGAATAAIAGSPAARGQAQTIYAAGPDGIFRLEGNAWQPLAGSWVDTIRDIAIDANGDLWLATMTGLLRLDPNNPDGDRDHLFLPDVVLSSNQYTLAWGDGGRLWLGSTGGIDIYEGTRRVRSITSEQGLPFRHARAIAFDGKDRVWVATNGGVARFDGDGWAVRHSRRWLLSDDARDIAIASDGTAWVATSRGVSAIRTKKMTLADKADHYLKIARARHVRPPGFVQKASLQAEGDLSTAWIPDTDNDGLFTANYVAAESFRYAVTGAPDALANARESFAALEFLQTITGTNHFVARTAVPKGVEPYADRNRTYSDPEFAAERIDDARWKKVEERWRPSADGEWLWKGDTSSDEITGHLFAYATYYDLAADEQERARVAALTARVIGGIVDNGFVHQDIDGQATRWGVWSPEKLNNDPNWRPERGVNSVEILSYLNVAWQQTGDTKFFNAARQLIEQHGYGENILKAKTTAHSELTHIDDQLLSLSYPSLISYEADPKLRTLYQASMRQWHPVIARDHSPLYDFVYNRFSGDEVPLHGAAMILRDWPLDLIEWTVDNRGREDIEIDKRPGLERVMVNRRLPPSEHHIIRWDANPYVIVDGEGGRREDEGVSWLLPYWMGRYYGLISPPAEEGRTAPQPSATPAAPVTRTPPPVPVEVLPGSEGRTAR